MSSPARKRLMSLLMRIWSSGEARLWSAFARCLTLLMTFSSPLDRMERQLSGADLDIFAVSKSAPENLFAFNDL